ncbi:MAG: GNAT family N-acetyltransferase, partial [Candidatus Nanoarchaeia archaeon]
MKGTKLHSRYVMGQFHPISTDAAADVICDFKKNVPEYCRIMRVQRDIPTYKTEAGVDRTNLRQYVDEKCRQNKIQCRCIRCRESGRFEKVGKASIKVDKYEASKGQEYFISAVDDKDILVGFCRMRFPSQVLVQEITEKSVLIRELHVYGEAVPIGTVGKGQQHKGYGRKLLEKAEKIAKKEGKDKIVVISGVGVREYYRSLGYRKEGPYMVKRI